MTAFVEMTLQTDIVLKLMVLLNFLFNVLLLFNFV